MWKLSKPVLDRAEVSSLIDNNIEDIHDTDHRVEGGQSSHGGEISPVVNNHEGEEDEDSGYKVHQHLQHQDDDAQERQCFVFVVVTKKSDVIHILERAQSIYLNLILIIE